MGSRKGRLQFDSFLKPLPVGLRSQHRMTRQTLYRAGNYTVDLGQEYERAGSLITLSGQVLPVGGIKEKVLAAKRAGIKEVILPKDNEPNVRQDLAAHLLEGLKLHFVKNVSEALELILGRFEPISAHPAHAGSAEAKPAEAGKPPVPVAVRPVH